jgi:hypothetical protein
VNSVETTPVAGGGERFSDAALARIRAHPRFGEAITACLRGGLALCENDPGVHRLSRDVSRYLMAVLTLYLHVSGGVSLKRLQALCIETGLCGRDRATALFLQLRLMRYVTAMPRNGDGRVRWYQPTEGLAAALSACMRNDLAAAAIVEPDCVPVLERFDEVLVFAPVVQTFGEGLLAFARAHEPKYPSLDIFSRKAGGMMIAGYLLLGGADGDAMPPRGPVKVSVRDLAQRCRVSRTQVLRLLREAEKVGYLSRNSGDGEVVISESLREELEVYFAILFLSMSVCAGSATGMASASRATRPN